jgi:hypothetical protein
MPSINADPQMMNSTREAFFIPDSVQTPLFQGVNQVDDGSRVDSLRRRVMKCPLGGTKPIVHFFLEWCDQLAWLDKVPTVSRFNHPSIERGSHLMQDSLMFRRV